ncbi:hypothetical protein [Mangrovihabitans endophyticus]|nr:hypothetical protein [Mangrovihabitans endophyticus]
MARVSAFARVVPDASVAPPLRAVPGYLSSRPRPGVASCVQQNTSIRRPSAGMTRPAPARPAPARPAPNRPAPAPIGPSSAGTGVVDLGDPAERARLVIEAQRSGIPRRGDIADEAADGAIDCVIALQAELTLRQAAGQPMDRDAVRAVLARAGLFKPDISARGDFAASTGGACVLGTMAGGKPVLSVAPLPPEGPCHLE